ncbi:MAG: CDP-diacylglycerol--glycerol-3-phosphate 3-phosphatidyltransferase [Verrucomicrobiota bacterium]
MNLPNKLTASRFVLTGAFLASVFAEFPYNETVALLLFGLAGLTDWLDGAIARSRNLTTNFGALMDPLADKILVCSAFIAFIAHPGIRMPAWIAVLIVSRELAITGLRLLAAAKNVVLAAEGWGKHKTIWQMVAIIAVLVQVGYPQWGVVGKVFSFGIIGARPWVDQFAALALGLTVILTVLSGGFYLWRNRDLYLRDM